MKLSGWGRYPRVACRVADFRGRIEERGPMIARGGGRAYGDAALHPNMTLLTRRMDRLLAFEDGRLTCEAGVTLDTVLRVFVPQGWFPPVVPGTRFVTIGGMVAADIHGKNHHEAGSFGCHVEALTIMLPDGRSVECSRAFEPELFFATIGGMGLTGIILTVTFRMIPIPSPWIMREVVTAADLDSVLAAFEDSAGWPYTVAWIDCLAAGSRLGRALLSRGEFVPHPQAVPPARAHRVPADPPGWLLNPWSVRAFNALYHARRPAPGLVPHHRFFFPLDGLLEWNRIYGKRGFAQYQCVLPKQAGREGLRRLLQTIARSGQGSFLAVLKLLGGQDSGGLLSFPMEGYTLALDFPLRPASLALMNELDAIVADHGGRLYLAKDSRAGATLLRRTQPNLDRFQSVRGHWGCLGAMQSLLAERLEL